MRILVSSVVVLLGACSAPMPSAMVVFDAGSPSLQLVDAGGLAELDAGATPVDAGSMSVDAGQVATMDAGTSLIAMRPYVLRVPSTAPSGSVPLVILLQGLVARFDAPAEVKYALILLVAFPLMLASYQTMVRYTWLGAILNGRRQPRTGARIPATSASGQEPA